MPVLRGRYFTLLHGLIERSIIVRKRCRFARRDFSLCICVEMPFRIRIVPDDFFVEFGGR